MPSTRRLAVVLRAGVLATCAVAAGCVDDSPLFDVPSAGAAPPAAMYAEAVDSSRAAARRLVNERYLPGVSVAVGRGGEVVWAEAFGWADLSRQTQATPGTLYPVGSISKPLTAAAAGVLYERGMLDFDVPIQTYLPDFPEKRWPITLRQLMGHNGGVMRNLGMGETLRQGGCPDALSALDAFAEDTLHYEPGTDHRYSNFGYRLVGAAVEAAAGEPFLAFVAREVFDRAGMETTVPDLGDEGADETTKYDRGAFNVLRATGGIDMSCSMAPGGFLSTPTELVRFGYAMLHRELLDSATVELYWTSQHLDTGEPTNYGFGWSIANVRIGDDTRASTPMIGHGGSVLGGRASLMIFPEQGMVVAAQTNASGDVSALVEEVAGFFRTPAAPPGSDRVGPDQHERPQG